MKFKPGDVLPTTVMEVAIGEVIYLLDHKRLAHLQFHRFVGRQTWNTHIAEFRKRGKEIEAARSIIDMSGTICNAEAYPDCRYGNDPLEALAAVKSPCVRNP